MINLDSEIRALRDGYEKLRSSSPAFTLGPLEGWPNGRWPRDFLHGLRDINQRAFDAQKELAPGRLVTEVASPWHAYFYLRSTQQRVFRAGVPVGPGRDAPTVGEHLFFRGQRCSNWSFNASIARKSPTEASAARRAARLLGCYFQDHSSFHPNVGEVAGHCFAQHYGIATDLIDVSCDADVAVWFATHPLGKSCPDGEGGAVRAVSWAGQMNDSSTAFYIPPPYVRNVYHQRGLFLDSRATNGQMIGQLTLDVRFPRETTGGEFKVFRSGAQLDIWPEVSKAEAALVTWASDAALTCDDNDVATTYKAAKACGDLPAFFLDSNVAEHELVEEWFEALDWLLPATCVTGGPNVNPPPPMRYEINGMKLDQLVDANPGFFALLAEVTRGADFSSHAYLEAIVDRANQRLATRARA